jgi:hypothetical protein
MPCFNILGAGFASIFYLRINKFSPILWKLGIATCGKGIAFKECPDFIYILFVEVAAFLTFNKEIFTYIFILKGQSQKKLARQGSLGCYSLALTKNRYWFFNLSDWSFKSYNF